MSATPDPDQQTVIDIDRGRHLVLAPPGCGKTFILAQRVIQAHARGTDYSDMLCLTFTNRASRAMRERISLHTNNPVPPDLFVGNVHRFCSNYLFDQKKIPQNSAVIDDIDSENVEVILDAVNLIPPEAEFDPDMQTRIIAEAFELYGRRISVLHLKDFVFEGSRQLYRHPGEGHFHYPALMQQIRNGKPGIIGLLENSTPDLYRRDCEYLKNQL